MKRVVVETFGIIIMAFGVYAVVDGLTSGWIFASVIGVAFILTGISIRHINGALR